MKGKQKFQKGDLVQIAKDLGQNMSHFTSDCRAIVGYSYADKFGGDNTDSYNLNFEGGGSSSWYYESQLTLIKKDQLSLLSQWEKRKEEEAAQKSDLDWIFNNGKKVLEKAHGSSIKALAECFGLIDLWGPHGEGITYYENASITLNLAKPFLVKNDKEGWIKFCSKLDLRRDN